MATVPVRRGKPAAAFGEGAPLLGNGFIATQTGQSKRCPGQLIRALW